MTLTTLTLYQRSSWLFRACPCRPALEGLPPSPVQLRHKQFFIKEPSCAPVAHHRRRNARTAGLDGCVSSTRQTHNGGKDSPTMEWLHPLGVCPCPDLQVFHLPFGRE